MEDILAIILIFGGGTAICLAFSPIGKAFAERIRGSAGQSEPDHMLAAEVDQLRHELGELQERVDFNERLLTQVRQADKLPGAQ
ncbi:MAG: hypothetical protein ABJD11_01680 [Gemmatimonadota bacterium]